VTVDPSNPNLAGACVTDRAFRLARGADDVIDDAADAPDGRVDPRVESTRGLVLVSSVKCVGTEGTIA